MEESKGKKFTNWLQDSLQAIIVIIIALFILFFLIYSYAKKLNNKEAMVDDNQKEDVIAEIPADEDSENSQIDENAENNENLKENANNELANNSENNNSENVNSSINKDQITENSTNNQESNNSDLDRGKGPSSVSVENENQSQSYKTEGVITTEINRGDSLTILARKAVAQYISENNVEGLTPAHKIYMEDYLQKKEKNRTINVGDSVSFSNDSINSAIQSAKSLNARQIQNLNGYANYVRGL